MIDAIVNDRSGILAMMTFIMAGMVTLLVYTVCRAIGEVRQNRKARRG